MPRKSKGKFEFDLCVLILNKTFLLASKSFCCCPQNTMRNISKVICFRSSRLLYSSVASHKSDISFYQNPCIRLRHLLEIPILDENELAFSPNVNAMVEAQKLFVSKPGNKIKKIVSTIHPENFPTHNLPEVAVIGQSNAGKSSLLSAIFKENPELRIKTSKKPGHTKSAQFFAIGEKLCLVDMPGYGDNQPACFTNVVENYLKRRRNLVKTLFLIDSKNGFEHLDDIALGMLEEFAIPYVIVMTKIDSASDGLQLRNLLHLKKIKDKYASLCCFSQIFMVSAHTYDGLAHLLTYIAYITGNLNLDVNENKKYLPS